MPETTPYPRILLTAFDAYRDGSNAYTENASRLALEQVVLQPPRGVALETRIYPVDFRCIRKQVEQDISRGFDLVILTGQAPGAGFLRLEMQSRNVGVDPNGAGQLFSLAPDGPRQFDSTLDWPKVLGDLPSGSEEVALSNDAGTFLCNAALYFGILAARRRADGGIGDTPTKVGFVHVPLTPHQAAGGSPSMPSERTAMLLSKLIEIAVLT